MPIHPEQDPPLEAFGPIVPLDALPDDQIEGPLPWDRPARPLTDFATQASPLLFGGGVFGQGMYNEDRVLYSDEAVRALRLAFRYGINALDSSPYYFPSEFVLGRALRILAPEYPRSSYFLITKCGRYGPDKHMFDYTPERISSSIHQSLARLGTDYLDVALLHDIEFVSEQPAEAQTAPDAGWLEACAVQKSAHVSQEDALRRLGVLPQDAGRIRGPGDEAVLEAARALFRLQDQGKVKHVGISGYPLGELLRIARLIASHPPYRCLDVVLNYSHHTLHSDVLPAWQALFEQPVSETWRAPWILNASPFSMGLFSDRGPPPWHPAGADLQEATKAAWQTVKKEAALPGSCIDPQVVMGCTALFRGIHGAHTRTPAGIPHLRTLIGMSNVDEVHAAIRVYRILCEPHSAIHQQLVRYERIVRTYIVEANAADRAWPSP